MTSYALILCFAYDSLADSAPATRSCPTTPLAKAGRRDGGGKEVIIEETCCLIHLLYCQPQKETRLHSRHSDPPDSVADLQNLASHTRDIRNNSCLILNYTLLCNLYFSRYTFLFHPVSQQETGILKQIFKLEKVSGQIPVSELLESVTNQEHTPLLCSAGVFWSLCSVAYMILSIMGLKMRLLERHDKS